MKKLKTIKKSQAMYILSEIYSEMNEDLLIYQDGVATKETIKDFYAGTEWIAEVIERNFMESFTISLKEINDLRESYGLITKHKKGSYLQLDKYDPKSN